VQEKCLRNQEAQHSFGKSVTLGWKSIINRLDLELLFMSQYVFLAAKVIIKTQMQKSNATPLVHELNILLANMTTEQRLKKAARHLDDALRLRSVRHDIDSINLLTFNQRQSVL